MIFKLINDKQEYESLAISTLDAFNSVDDWLQFFDIWKYSEEKYDEINNWDEFLQGELDNGNLSIDYAPSSSEYPVILVHLFEKEWDRYSDTTTQIWDWESLSKLKAENEYSIGVVK